MLRRLAPFLALVLALCHTAGALDLACADADCHAALVGHDCEARGCDEQEGDAPAEAGCICHAAFVPRATPAALPGRHEGRAAPPGAPLRWMPPGVRVLPAPVPLG